jgi:replicative DNA helicase
MGPFPYGEVFQSRVLGLCFREPRFLDNYGHLLKKEYFGVGTYGHLLLVAQEYYGRYKRPPDVETARDLAVAYCLRMRFGDSIRTDLLTALEQALHSDLTEMSYVVDEVVSFVRQRELASAVLDCAEQLEKGQVQYDAVLSRIQKAVSVGVSMDTGALFGVWAQDLTARLGNDNLFGDGLRVKTRIPELDDRALSGGMTPGQIGVVMGSSGRGKSMCLTSFGAAALRDGFSVFHYTLENSELDTILRYASNITGVRMSEIKRGSQEYAELIAEWKDRPQQLMVKYFPKKGISVAGLRSHVSHTISQTGIRPALIIVDYPDLMDLGIRGVKGDDLSRTTAMALGDVYSDLINMGTEHHAGLWVASQIQRGAWGEESVRGDHAADGIKKIDNSDIVVTLCQTPAQKQEHKMRLGVVKSRRGEDGYEVPCIIDFSRAKVTQDREAILRKETRKNGSGNGSGAFEGGVPAVTDAAAIAASFGSLS